MTASTEPDVTISICEEPGHDGHAARITIADRTSTSTFCLPLRHAGFVSQALAQFAPKQAADPDGQQRYIDQLHDLIRDMLTAYPGLAIELPGFQDRAGELFVHDHDGQPFSGSEAGQPS
jgi:hypothetical protein